MSAENSTNSGRRRPGVGASDVPQTHWRRQSYKRPLRQLVLAAAIVVAMPLAAQEVSIAARSALTQGGKLRVGLNLANSVTVTKDTQTGELRGVAVDLSRALASTLGVTFEPVLYPSPAKMAEAASAGQWDVAFLAIDPARSRDVAFTAPYMEVHNSYLVPPGSNIQAMADVDQPGVRISVGERNANDLFLSRSLRQATLVRAAGEAAGFELLRTGQVQVQASGRGLLLAYAANWPGARVLEGHFLAVEHAIGVPVGRVAGLAYVRDFVEQAKRSGQIQRSLDRQGVAGVVVAPALAK